MDKENDKQEIFSERVRAGKRTYFFDVKATRSNDYYLTITESKRRYKEDGFTYEKHKIFLYKEDFDKFQTALGNTISHVKDELMPDVDFGQFERTFSQDGEQGEAKTAPPEEAKTVDSSETAGAADSTALDESVGEDRSEPEVEGEPAAQETQETESGIDSELKWD